MTRHAVWHMWRLREADDENLGLAFTDDNLLIGRTPLIEKHGQFVVRQQHDIERLLSRAYRSEIRADRLMSGLATVARALNANDQCLARIAAVHLRVPDIPDRAARDAMEAMNAFIKYARDGGDSDWNPALHPRTGTPPNPGWFAPTGGSGESSSMRTAQNGNFAQRSDASTNTNDDWVRLPPPRHTRIDELADLMEWIANAKPEDEAAITGEIDRYFKAARWEGAARDLQRKLSLVLRPGTTKERRQEILNTIDPYSWNDPTEVVGVTDVVNELTGVAAGLPSAATGTTSAAEEAARQSRAATGLRAAEVAVANTPSEIWKYGWAKRGRIIHDLLGDGSLHPNFPTIDMFSPGGVITSIKSIDLKAATYQNEGSLAYRLNGYFDKVSEFDGAKLADDIVSSDKITSECFSWLYQKAA
jgi:hypothetical protein